MKVLIVDDSKLNRIVLKELIKEYQLATKEEFEISEAEDGLAAVDACKQEFYDLVFMDIMMPRMDGISATEIINKESKKTMIIAVSAIEDDHHKRDILRKGAEDYVQKPINNEIFLKRLAHYVGIIKSRSAALVASAGVENLLDTQVYSRKLTFTIFNQQTLGEFWDYFMQSEHNDILADLIRLFYGIGVWQLKLGYKFYVYMEENTDTWYFTMTNVKLLSAETLMRIIEKNYANGIFKIDGDRLSFSVAKIAQVVQEEQAQPIVQVAHIAPAATIATPAVAVAMPTMETVALTVFDFIELEDKEELAEITDNLRSLMLMVGSSELENNDISHIAAYLQKFAKILGSYHEVYTVASIVRDLGNCIQDNTQAFKERSKDIAQLCRAFNNDLAMWLKKLFIDGAPSTDFMDQSLASDANMLMGFLKTTQAASVDVDNIFDF